MLLTKSAILIDSCNNLFNAVPYKNQIITTHFPFLESVFEALWEQLENQGEIIFPGVETKHSFLPGYYDYVFKIANKERELIEWQIIDVTENYEAIRIKQQEDNENSAFGSSST